ncbi:MAG: hypothetical protein U1E65_19575 [Myxococcota bacterium]
MSTPLETAVSAPRLSEANPEVTFPAPLALGSNIPPAWTALVSDLLIPSFAAYGIGKFLEASSWLPVLLGRAASSLLLGLAIFTGLVIWLASLAALAKAGRLVREGGAPQVQLGFRSFECPISVLEPRSLKRAVRSSDAGPRFIVGWDEIALWRVLKGMHEIRLRSGKKILLRRSVLAGHESAWLPVVRERIGDRLQL